jgi:quercetin dioxygenase-like cupin family protein
MEVGSIVLPPGREVVNHYHRHVIETFFTLSGRVTLWMNARDRVELGPGDFIACDPYVMTYFVCEDDEPWQALFVKAPHGLDDAVVVPWRPGEPAPQLDDGSGAATGDQGTS